MSVRRLTVVASFLACFWFATKPVQAQQPQVAGAVEPGKEADLVVLAANPLESLQNTERIEMVVKAGQLYRP